MGQWLSPDPAFDGLNLYAYVHNNPINMVDPTGLSAEYGRDNPIPVARSGLGSGQQFFQADNAGEAGFQDAATFDRNSANSPVYEANNNGLSPQAAMALGSMGSDARSSTAGMENGGLGPIDSALQAGMVGGAVANMESGSAIRTDGSGSAMGTPGGKCSSCEGGRGYQAAYIGLTAGMLFGGAAMQGYAGTLRASTQPRFFWSGRGAMNEAMSMADSVGGLTLEMTMSGRALTQMGRVLPRAAMGPLWRGASAFYAYGANGPVTAVLRSPRAGSIWNTIEKPILVRRGVPIQTR